MGPVDFIFIDHDKSVYVPDFKLMEGYGMVGKGSVVVGDNMIFPGCPEYIEHIKARADYDSVLYHSFVEYSAVPDAVLVSVKNQE